jgi:hypothetical protein
VREELKRTQQALEADAGVTAEPAAADAGAERAGGGAGALASKAQARTKKADDYHARHAEWVAQFNELTGNECAGGAGGVKWAAVRAWQQKHWQLNNLLADGLVGPKTLEAAKLLKKQTAGAKDDKKDAAGAKESDGAEAKQHAEPEAGPGAADGAEAAADKPKLDDEAEEAAEPAGATDSDAKLPASGAAHAKPGKHASLADFNAMLQKIEKVLSDWKQPAGSEGLPQTALAKANGQEVKDPTKEATPHGAMMQHLGEYRAEIANLTPDVWERLGTPEKRAEVLTSALNKTLATEQVRPVDDETAKLSGQDAHFTPDTWIMTVNAAKLARGRVSVGDIESAGSDVFHEGKHAEQRFSVARMMARQAMEAKTEITPAVIKDISQKSHIHADAVTDAVDVERKQPMTPGSPEQKDAGAFLDDTVTHHDEHSSTEKTAKLINTIGLEASSLFHSLDAKDQAAMRATWEAYRVRMFKVFDAYQRLPVEKDAFAAEKELGLSKAQ